MSGQSQMNLSASGSIRDDLLADSFIAVLERDRPDGMVDTVRVVVPSEPAIREFLNQFVHTLGKQVVEDSHCYAAFSELASLPLSVSYVSDLLASTLRRPPQSRPTVNVIGARLAEGIILGEAIQFSHDPRWYNLFPISICVKAEELAEKAQTALAALPPPV